MDTVMALLIISVVGNNVGHLNSRGVQVSIAPVPFESVEVCNRKKAAVIAAVQKQVQAVAELSKTAYEPPLKLTTFSGTCEPL